MRLRPRRRELGPFYRRRVGPIIVAELGKRSRSESVIKVFLAFSAQKRWRQPQLAERVGVNVHALRKLLDELGSEGFPVRQEKVSHADVYWFVPDDWGPGGAVFDADDLEALLHQLAFAPESDERNQIMDRIATCLSGTSEESEQLRSIVVAPEPPADEETISRIVQAATNQIVIRCRYFSQKRGVHEERRISVQRIVGSERFVGVCHRSGDLKWWRFDNVRDVELEPEEQFRQLSDDEVDRYLESSIDGFQAKGPVRELRFFVRGSDAAWVSKNLPKTMTTESAEDGIVVIARTAAITQVARYVLWLGGLARPETPELKAAVAELAEKVLQQVKPE